MIEVLDADLNIRALSMEENPNVYYISYAGYTKSILEIKETNNNNIILSCFPQGDCLVEELNIIIDRFSKFIYANKPDINGILLKCDPSELLSSIGFDLLSENSEFLYQENLNKNKEREGLK